jgi:PEP-CTERM putative exosortase interaction domain
MAAPAFFDDFSGPVLSHSWQASLPAMRAADPDSGGSAAYLGAPNYAFQSLGSDSVLRLSNSMGPHQRVGWSTTDTFSGSFRYEVRFNTLNQSGNTSIDAFLEIGILDAADTSRYDILSPYGGNFSSSRRFAAGSSIDNSFNHTFFDYQNDTWYRMVLEGDPGQNLRASLLSDTGTELAAFNLGHTADAYTSGYRLFLSQALGNPFPGSSFPVDVAVDYAQLTLIPEPTSVALIVCGCGLFYLRRRRSA